MPNSLPDPLLIEMNRSARRMKIRHFIHRAIYLAVAAQGLRHIFLISKEIIFVYPKIATYFQATHFNQSAYTELLRQAALASVTSFLETGIGLAMMVKETHTIKTIHALIGIGVFLLSYYLRKEGAVLDFKAIEELAFLIPRS